MTEKISKTLRESSVARWAALLLLSSTMFFAYMFIVFDSFADDCAELTGIFTSAFFNTFLS